MDSRSNLFIVVTTVLLAILIVGGVVVENLTRPEVTAPDESAVPPQESVNTELLFTEEAQKYDDVAPPQELPIVDDTASSEPNTNAEEPEPATTTATTTPIPSVSITAGGTTQVGTLGSYCWEGECSSSIVGDIPSSPLTVSASGTISYAIDSEVPPERVLIFLKKPNTTDVLLNRELTASEVLASNFALDLFYGEHLLFITGVFPGNQDVVHAFKIDIQ